VLITWTSNIQGWKSHSAFEYSNQMQTVEIYTPIRDEAGKFVGLNHETILYDAGGPRRAGAHRAQPAQDPRFTDADETPLVFIECIPTIFSVKGINAPVKPGEVIEYEVPDMYGRPWDAIWSKYFEQGMKRPETDESMFEFK
jgi:hypothetical protein